MFSTKSFAERTNISSPIEFTTSTEWGFRLSLFARQDNCFDRWVSSSTKWDFYTVIARWEGIFLFLVNLFGLMTWVTILQWWHKWFCSLGKRLDIPLLRSMFVAFILLFLLTALCVRNIVKAQENWYKVDYYILTSL